MPQNIVKTSQGKSAARYNVSLEHLGTTRRDALFNPNVGPYTNKPLDQQYLILPRSVVDTHGPSFIDDLTRTMNALYPQEVPYHPTQVTYNDLGTKTYGEQGRAILRAIDEEVRTPGFGIAMIHETVDRKNREHDQLAAMVMRELRNRDLFVSVIHTTMTTECYHLPPGAAAYEPVPDKCGKLNGYLRNVALTKILLTNERWPFVLHTPLHADLTIAIDVLLHTACFTFIGKSGPDIRTVTKTSTQKERLSKAQVKQVILDVLRQEASLGRAAIKDIVIQRDGRLFTTEKAGIKEAIATLKADGTLPAAASVSFIEIPESSAASFRLFGIQTRPGGQEVITNPPIGAYFALNNQDAYLCSTGQEFQHPGTTRPLHVRYVEGTMPFSDLLDDVYALTCLAWTRPEDCSREPITIKLADIRLREHAGKYDPDALSYDEETTEEVETQ